VAPKNERFEMRLDATMIDRIDQWSIENGDISRAEAARKLILHGLDRTIRHGVNFTDGEKMIVAMLADLDKPKDRREIDPSEIMKAIQGGHYWALKWDLPGLYHDHVDDPGALSLVLDTLDMWSFIEEAVETFSPNQLKQIEDEVGLTESSLLFPGFDGNHEGTHLRIAGQLVKNMDRFPRFKGRRLNTHCPMIETYARMNRLFQPIRTRLGDRKPIRLSFDEVVSLLQRDT